MYMVMLMILFFISLIILVSMLIYLINLSISLVKSTSKDKKSSYECGFNPITKAFIPFSVPFYLMALMFLVFDIEIMLIIPFILLVKFLGFSNVLIVFLFFFFIMLFSLVYEWCMNYLSWTF